MNIIIEESELLIFTGLSNYDMMCRRESEEQSVVATHDVCNGKYFLLKR